MLAAATVVGLMMMSQNRYVTSGKANGHSYRVSIEQRPFSARGRKLGAVKVEETYFPSDHGHRLYGWDGWSKKDIFATVLPQLKQDTEVANIDVTIDGHHVPVPRRWFDDLLEPHPAKDYVRASITRAGVLHLSLQGSDAAGGYQANWIIHRNGRISRKVEEGD